MRRRSTSFVNNALNGFSNGEEPKPVISVDTTHVEIWDSKYERTYSWADWNHSHKFVRYGVPKYVPWIPENMIEKHLMLRYNRVESIFLGLGSEKKYYWEDGKAFNPFGSIGYGFGSHRWAADLGLTRQIAIGSWDRDRLIEIGVEGYTMTDSKDQWRISSLENSLASFFIHEDFRDYYWKAGGKVHTAYLVRDHELFGEVRVAYQVDRYRSMDNSADWALFGGHKSFRDNPQINEGMMRSIGTLAGFSTASRRRYGTGGLECPCDGGVRRRGIGRRFPV